VIPHVRKPASVAGPTAATRARPSALASRPAASTRLRNAATPFALVTTTQS